MTRYWPVLRVPAACPFLQMGALYGKVTIERTSKSTGDDNPIFCT